MARSCGKRSAVMPRRGGGLRFSRKRREAPPLPKVSYRGGTYYVATPAVILTSGLEGYPVYIKSKVIGRPQIAFRRPLPFIGGEHEHAVIFTIEGGLTVVFHGVAFLREGDSVEVYGVVRDKKQIVASAIVTDWAEYSYQI